MDPMQNPQEGPSYDQRSERRIHVNSSATDVCFRSFMPCFELPSWTGVRPTISGNVDVALGMLA